MSINETLLSVAALAGLCGGCSGSKAGEAEFLFVQDAATVACDGETLVLDGIHTDTVYFSDRPQRIVGPMATEVFVDSWVVGPDSFADDPPNATLSVFDDGEVRILVVELSNPRLEDRRLTYDVALLAGEAPVSGENCTLFIDSRSQRRPDDRRNDRVAHRSGQGRADHTIHDRSDDRDQDRWDDRTQDRHGANRTDDRVRDRHDDRVDRD